MGRSKTINKKRNDFIHSIWLIDGKTLLNSNKENPLVKYKINSFKLPERIQLDQINDTISDIQIIIQELLKLLNKVRC